VYVRRSEYRPTPGSEAPPVNTVGEFLAWFQKRGEDCRMPCPPFQSEDYGIAARLLKKHGEGRLKELAGYFWLWKSGALREEEYPHAMKLFASKIPMLEAILR